MKIINKAHLIFLSLSLFILSGCAVLLASNQPELKNTSLFAVGTPRSKLIAEFGIPTIIENRNGKNYDIFIFIQGYSKSAKTGRAIFHGVADVASFGAWELIGTPIETIFDGNRMVFEVSYDEENKVSNISNLSKQSQ